MTTSILKAIEDAKPYRLPNTRDRWPEPLDPAAFHGIAGEIVRAIEPHTEADPAALLIHVLTYAGNALGRGPHAIADGARHGTNLFTCVVGATSKGRKGSADAHVRNIFRLVDESWAMRISSGLSSGEGVIAAVKDGVERETDTGEVVLEGAVDDKRMLVVESELAGPLKKMQPQGNILSPILRQAWDSGMLHQIVKTNPLHATDAHISIVGHISSEELRRLLNEIEVANGLANRFLFACAKRTNVLPEGGGQPAYAELAADLSIALSKGRMVGLIERDQDAKASWAAVYPNLSEGKPGLIGALRNRAEAQVQRLQNVYAALDGSAVIRPVHVDAALAVWEYSERSIRYVFGGNTGNKTADKILQSLSASMDGLTRTQISQSLGNNVPSVEIQHALDVLQGNQLAVIRSPIEGEPSAAEVWVSIS
jgi:hypothetical protein